MYVLHIHVFLAAHYTESNMYIVHVYMYMYMNNQVYRALLRKNEKGKKEKERKLQPPQRLRKI